MGLLLPFETTYFIRVLTIVIDIVVDFLTQLLVKDLGGFWGRVALLVFELVEVIVFVIDRPLRVSMRVLWLLHQLVLLRLIFGWFCTFKQGLSYVLNLLEAVAMRILLQFTIVVRGLLVKESSLNVAWGTTYSICNELLEQIELRIEKTLQNRVLHAIAPNSTATGQIRISGQLPRIVVVWVVVAWCWHPQIILYLQRLLILYNLRDIANFSMEWFFGSLVRSFVRYGHNFVNIELRGHHARRYAWKSTTDDIRSLLHALAI